MSISPNYFFQKINPPQFTNTNLISTFQSNSSLQYTPPHFSLPSTTNPPPTFKLTAKINCLAAPPFKSPSANLNIINMRRDKGKGAIRPDDKMNEEEHLAGRSNNARQNLHCAVCLGILADVKTISCMHSFCFNCIKDLKACPLCRKQYSFQVENFSVTGVTKNLLFKCNFVGCTWVGGRNHLPEHFKMCIHNPEYKLEEILATREKSIEQIEASLFREYERMDRMHGGTLDDIKYELEKRAGKAKGAKVDLESLSFEEKEALLNSEDFEDIFIVMNEEFMGVKEKPYDTNADKTRTFFSDYVEPSSKSKNQDIKQAIKEAEDQTCEALQQNELQCWKEFRKQFNLDRKLPQQDIEFRVESKKNPNQKKLPQTFNSDNYFIIQGEGMTLGEAKERLKKYWSDQIDGNSASIDEIKLLRIFKALRREYYDAEKIRDREAEKKSEEQMERQKRKMKEKERLEMLETTEEKKAHQELVRKIGKWDSIINKLERKVQSFDPDFSPRDFRNQRQERRRPQKKKKDNSKGELSGAQTFLNKVKNIVNRFQIKTKKDKHRDNDPKKPEKIYFCDEPIISNFKTSEKKKTQCEIIKKLYSRNQRKVYGRNLKSGEGGQTSEVIEDIVLSSINGQSLDIPTQFLARICFFSDVHDEVLNILHKKERDINRYGEPSSAKRYTQAERMVFDRNEQNTSMNQSMSMTRNQLNESMLSAEQGKKQQPRLINYFFNIKEIRNNQNRRPNQNLANNYYDQSQSQSEMERNGFMNLPHFETGIKSNMSSIRNTFDLVAQATILQGNQTMRKYRYLMDKGGLETASEEDMQTLERIEFEIERILNMNIELFEKFQQEDTDMSVGDFERSFKELMYR